MKFNWGTRIAIFYIVFVIGMVYLVVRSTQQSIDLVTDDYYAQEIKYQNRIDDVERTSSLSSQPTISYAQDIISINMPAEFKDKEVTGSILLYCPANAANDQRMNFQTKDGMIRMSVPEKNSGQHEVQISWEANGKTYYANKAIFIP